MRGKILILMGFGLAIALSPQNARAVALDPTCGCEGQVSEPVATAIGGLAGEALTNRIASLVAGNGALAQDVVCATHGLDAARIEAIGAGLARSGLSAEQTEASLCCAEPGLLGAFARVTDDICGGQRPDARDGGALARGCSRTPHCVKAVLGDLTQLVTRGFGASTGRGDGDVGPSRP